MGPEGGAKGTEEGFRWVSGRCFGKKNPSTVPVSRLTREISRRFSGALIVTLEPALPSFLLAAVSGGSVWIFRRTI